MSDSPAAAAAAAASTETGSHQRNKRKPHRKARSGCYECKKRRIKCDELKPECTYCTRHQADCVYPVSSNPSVYSRRTPQYTASPSTDTPSVPDSPKPAQHHQYSEATEIPSTALLFTAEDLSLYHHWILSASQTIVQCPDSNQIWQSTIPSVGFRWPFVLHGILGLSALHQAHGLNDASTKWQHYFQIAIRHHSIAMQGFNTAVASSSPDVGDALFALATINIIYVFAAYKLPVYNDSHQESSVERRNRILGTDWVTLVRGVQAVLDPFYESIRHGELAPLLDTGNWSSIDINVPRHLATDEENIFSRLSDAWMSDDSGVLPADAELYSNTLDLLRRALIYTMQFEKLDEQSYRSWGYNRSTSGPMIWIMAAPNEFFVRLKQRQPYALLIFAYFGVVLHKLRHIWYLGGWSRKIVFEVDEILGDYWVEQMRWARTAVSSS